MRVYVVTKWPASVCSDKMAAPREKSFCVMQYHTVSLWLLCNVRFVQSKQTTGLQDLSDLKLRIIEAVKNIDAPMLTRVGLELEYFIDVCRVTSGAHMEHI